MTPLMIKMLASMEKIRVDYADGLVLRQRILQNLRQDPYDLIARKALEIIEVALVTLEVGLTNAEDTIHEIARWN